MRKPIVIYKTFDIVSVPFPFTDSAKNKKRPALVLSFPHPFHEETGHLLLAMITSRKNKPWVLDIPITHLPISGLKHDSVIRMKLFTLDIRFVISKIGELSVSDQRQVKSSLQKLLKDFV